MNESKKGRQPLADCVFRPLAAGGLILCAAFTAAAAAAVYPSAREAACLGWLVLGAGTVFVLVGGGVLWLLRSVCQRYLSPVAQAATAAAQAAARDHSAALSSIPRTCEEVALLLDAAENMGNHRAGCLLEMEGVLRRMGDGDLSARLPCGKGAECGGACGALEGMAQRLRGAVGSVRSALGQLIGQLDGLEQDMRRLSQSGQDRRQDREDMARSMERLSKRLQNRAEGAQAVSGGAEELCRYLEDYGRRIEELTRSVERISDCAAGAGTIVKTMESTAFQCSVLARTAYTEAAGAGINGKGFAVVASEMRVLASRSAQAAQEAAAMMEEMERTIREGSALTAKASRELWGVSGSSEELRRRAAGAAQEAREVREEQKAVCQAARFSAREEENQLLAARAAASASILKERAGRLRETLRVFRLS